MAKKYIDADELLERLNSCKYPAEKTTMRRVTYNAAISDARRSIDAMPAADVQEVRHGWWEGKPIAGYSTVRCSVCGAAYTENSGRWSYCPNCGASMMDDNAIQHTERVENALGALDEVTKE